MLLMYDHIFNNTYRRIIKQVYHKEYQSILSVPLLNLEVFVCFIEVLEKVFAHYIIEFASRLGSEVFRNVWRINSLIEKSSPVEILEEIVFSDLLECCTTSLLWVFYKKRIYQFSGVLILQEFREGKIPFFDCSIYSIRISRRVFTKG